VAVECTIEYLHAGDRTDSGASVRTPNCERQGCRGTRAEQRISDARFSVTMARTADEGAELRGRPETAIVTRLGATTLPLAQQRAWSNTNGAGDAERDWLGRD